VQPKVFYEYADPKLEVLSAGQKILLRMGSANAEQIKAKLREIRQALTRVSPRAAMKTPRNRRRIQSCSRRKAIGNRA